MGRLNHDIRKREQQTTFDPLANGIAQSPHWEMLEAIKSIISRIAGDQIAMTPIKQRDFFGYRQFQESYDVRRPEGGYKIVRRWCFYVAGFSNDNKEARVLKSDGTYEYVPIDHRHRITINGRKYTQNNWYH